MCVEVSCRNKGDQGIWVPKFTPGSVPEADPGSDPGSVLVAIVVLWLDIHSTTCDKMEISLKAIPYRCPTLSNNTCFCWSG